ncbi:MAG: hypothetical protein U0325_35225 [Polyangiales bacterium]
MRRANGLALACWSLGLVGCARAIVPEVTDAQISGSTDLPIVDDVVGVNWDDYPDKNNLVDLVQMPSDRGVVSPDRVSAPDVVAVAGCGVPGAVCCTGNRCGRGAECRGDVCAEVPSCGATGQACCGVAACGPGNMCTGGTCASMVTCGASGGPCCAGGSPCLTSLRCAGGACVPCGGAGQSCCEGAAACFRGLSCGGGLCRAAM